MECNNESVERQKLVSDDGDQVVEEEQIQTTNITNTNPPKNVQTPISPVLSSKMYSSGETSRSQNSTTGSIGKSNNTDTGPPSARLMYINERKLHDSKVDFKSKSRKIPREPSPIIVQQNNDVSLSFSSRSLKHHSFISEVPDVRHMERALLGLLEDFHSGKLRAFGSGCTMDQMTDIREQQERLAKLHFELGQGIEHKNGVDVNGQENMSQLVEKLEQLSVSIEKLHSTNSDL